MEDYVISRSDKHFTVLISQICMLIFCICALISTVLQINVRDLDQITKNAIF